MLTYLFVLFTFAYIFSRLLPLIYTNVKQKAIEQGNLLLSESSSVGVFPVIAITMFSFPAFILYLSGDIFLSLFCFCLSLVAYTDLCVRWIPDLLIYMLLAISILSVRNLDLSQLLWSSSFYLMPAILLSVYGVILKGEKWIASGDYYIFPSIGLMITPKFAATIMLVNLFLTLMLSIWVKKIPLVTVAYFTYLGYQICMLLGFI